MNPYITEMEAIPVSKPHMVAVFNSNTLEETQHLAYEAEMQYKRKPNEIKTILCSRLDTVNVGEPVMLVYHHGMRSYKHNRNVIVSNSRNCLGGFYYTDGTKA
tara:strand:+ start:222 stop:530 length:309 start_codon:yes stop_codon:yes gene_type:complete